MFSIYSDKAPGWPIFYLFCCFFHLILLLLFPVDAIADKNKRTLPVDIPMKEPNASQTLPLPPAENPENPLSTMASLYVKKIILEGNTVFSDAELSTITKKYERRFITAEELQALRLALTAYYVDKGFINSGVVIPDQQIKNGLIRFQVMEGKLSRTVIAGNHILKEQYIRNRLAPEIIGGETPLNIFELQQDLKRLKEDSHIETIHAKVIPGARRGEAFLHVKTEEAPRYTALFQMDNHGSPGTGSIGEKLHLQYRSLTGRGDDATMAYRKTRGIDNWQVKYTLPVNRHRTHLALEMDRTESQVISKPFSILDISGKSGGESLIVSQRLHNSLNTDFSAGFELERRFSKTYYQGKHFSYSEGSVDGRICVTVLRFFQQWRHRTLDQVAVANSTFNFGFDGPGTTFSGKEPDARFFSWFGQFQWLKRLPIFDSRLSFMLMGQMADDPLFSMEKFILGGVDTLRGYRENILSGDQGGAASLEWQIPVGSLRLPGISTHSTDGTVHLIPFFDYGGIHNKMGKEQTPRNICSLGLGMKWNAGKRLHVELFWGKRLKSMEKHPDRDLQDKGFHFKISGELF